MNLSVSVPSPSNWATMADMAVAAPATQKGPPKFKQRSVRTFKSKAPKPGQKGWGRISIRDVQNRQIFPWLSYFGLMLCHTCPGAHHTSSSLVSLLLSASETTSLAWRALAQTSLSSARGKPLVTWSSVTWPNTELFNSQFLNFFPPPPMQPIRPLRELSLALAAPWGRQCFLVADWVWT